VAGCRSAIMGLARLPSGDWPGARLQALQMTDTGFASQCIRRVTCGIARLDHIETATLVDRAPVSATPSSSCPTRKTAHAGRSICLNQIICAVGAFGLEMTAEDVC